MIRKISSQEVVDIFLEFFESRGHTKIPGHPLVPRNDPSLLFINSGMAPLKPYFLGQERPPSPDLCNIQRCIRTNDIEEVGDRHHLTYFEMMGSWSIGHYWKEQAIAYAWELLTKGFGFPPERLYASVYAGNPELGVPADEESLEIWQRIGLAKDHIVLLGEDNFWGPAGAFGPCGPCTEVFFDTGDEFGERYAPGGHFDDVNRYIEIWNAGVFMEYNKLPDGLSKLEMRSVDTGSGLERMVMALNGVETVYETDLLRPLVEFAAAQLGGASTSDRATRLISDHIRAAAMMLADRVKPAASGPGYIPRRLIRRAIAAAYQHGGRAFDFTGLLELAIAGAGSWNPHVAERRDEIHALFAREREEFEATLEVGIRKLADAYEAGQGRIDGAGAFRLFSTYGLPVDTIREYFLSRGGTFDEAGFDAAFSEHQDLSRSIKDENGKSEAAAGLDGLPQTEFVGYAHLETEGAILAILKDGARADAASAGDEVLVVVDKTSFYSEGGGQVGDRGAISTDEARCKVVDVTSPAFGIYAHKCVVESGMLRERDVARLAVDPDHRRRVQANHSATHLLHSALRKVLGEDVGQAGSLVDADRLRFDFTYPDKIPEETLLEIEDMVNEAIRANSPRAERLMRFDEAVEGGALAFFGDKYGDEVRTIGFGDFSMELCGGTHVSATGDIGLFLIVSEGSVARGVRRIQALTGADAFRLLRDHDRILHRVSARLNARPGELEDRVAALLSRSKAGGEEAGTEISAKSLAAEAIDLGDGLRAVIKSLDIPTKQMQALALDVAQEIQGIAVLVVAVEDKASVTVAVHKSQTERRRADTILKRLLPLVEGRGGGKDTLAAGSGPNVSGVEELLDEARQLTHPS